MPDAEPPAKTPIPGWAWIFVVACAFIPIATMGGAIPGAIGGGGVGGCIALARNRSFSAPNRVLLCAITTLAAWAIAIVVLGGVGRLNLPGR